jgi:xanthine dehydrogenase accessory factor
LDIRAETPEEIAVSIAAELVRVRRGGTGASLRDRARVVERWIDRGSRAPGDTHGSGTTVPSEREI